MDASEDVAGCLACALSRGRIALPGGLIHVRGDWRVEHCVGQLGLGTLLVKPLRHVESVADLSPTEAAELGPLLQQTAAVVRRLCHPDQVYVCLWSHAGGQPAHIHFIVQPATAQTIAEHDDLYGPALQMAMFTRGIVPEEAAVAEFAARAHDLFAIASRGGSDG